MQEKMNNIFYIIAAGGSFKDVTDAEWKYLEDKHTICFARVPYGSKKTEYYFSVERDYIDKSVLTYMAKIGYLDTKLILYIPESIELAKKLGFKHIRWVNKETFYFMPNRQPWFENEEHPPSSFDETMAKSFRQPIFRFRGQLTAVVNACLILGATEIRLIGVDLNDQDNFYSNFDYLRIVCKDEQTVNDFIAYLQSKDVVNRLSGKTKFNPDFNPSIMHTTNMPHYERERWGDRPMRGVADILEWVDKSMQEKGMNGVYITNKTSFLYTHNKLRYKGIMEE